MSGHEEGIAISDDMLDYNQKEIYPIFTRGSHECFVSFICLNLILI